MIITADLDEFAQQEFNALRKLHFPPDRNFLDAHLTLFHALPDDREPEVIEQLQEVTDRESIDIEVTGVRMLGNGVAYKLSSPDLLAVRQSIARKHSEVLTNQDRQKADLHITIQNKVDSEMAKRLHAELTERFEPTTITAIGLHLWRYDNGPWTSMAMFPFESR